MENTVMTQSDKIASIVAFFSIGFTWLFGGWEIGLQILIVFMVSDYTTGILRAFRDNELDSKVGFKGLSKKFSILIVLIIGVALDRLLGTEWTFRTLVIYFYVAMEGLSILENIAKLGVPIPEKLKEKLIQLAEDTTQEVD